VVAYAVAISFRHQRPFDLATGVSELLQRAGFIEIEVKQRRMSSKKILPAGRDVASGRFSSRPTAGIAEFVVYARNP
jgi:hypothetical protein